VANGTVVSAPAAFDSLLFLRFLFFSLPFARGLAAAVSLLSFLSVKDSASTVGLAAVLVASVFASGSPTS
jgi:hypothetical protein